MKSIVFFIFLSIGLWADSTQYASLFGKVIGVAEHDTLNIRSKPDYKSKKLGELPPEAYIGIEKCKTIKKSTWCKVYQIAQQFYEGYNESGWVNANYLKPSNRGYVIVDKKRNCDYVLRCKEGKCEVVSSYITDENHEITSIKTKWIVRENLRGESHFGAVYEDGYCTLGNWVEDYLQKKRYNELLKQDSDLARHKAIAFSKTLRTPYKSDEIIPYMHPKKGIVMTWGVLFGGGLNIRFGYSDIKNIYIYSKKKIHWGQTYGKGDDVFMNLYAYMDMLTRSISNITKVAKLTDLKGFKCHPSSECRGYEVFWINEESETKEYDYLGLVIILEKYKGEWYVVGILRDRWTI